MKKIIVLIATLVAVTFSACGTQSAANKESEAVERQQTQFAKGQPVPASAWSLERDLLIKLYNLRNERVSTHSVWRSDYGMIEGECQSMGYGLPYDTSLTNPFMLTHKYISSTAGRMSGVVGQAEPNGIFASTNTSATWVMCIGAGGTLQPHYVESKVTVYPYLVKVNFETNRVTRVGKKSVSISQK